MINILQINNKFIFVSIKYFFVEFFYRFEKKMLETQKYENKKEEIKY